MGPLAGTRVVDFGQWIAGPLAAMLLGDQGPRSSTSTRYWHRANLRVWQTMSR
jgi:crotonobetainyl-CoA:carnitine CoA-transferase CaiB-like acyl-CoA transferase